MSTTKSTVLVKLAQELRKEGYLIHEQAEIDVNAIRLESENSLHVAMCKIAAIISESHNAIIGERAINAAKYKSKAAIACKRHAKEMLVQQRECNILVNDVKKKAATTRKQHTNQLIVQQKDFDDIAKDLNRTSKGNAKSDAVVIGNLKLAFSATLRVLR